MTGFDKVQVANSMLSNISSTPLILKNFRVLKNKPRKKNLLRLIFTGKPSKQAYTWSRELWKIGIFGCFFCKKFKNYFFCKSIIIFNLYQGSKRIWTWS